MIDLPKSMLTRRNVLGALGVGAAGLAASSVLSGCVGVGGTPAPAGGGSAADGITGTFDWKRAAGTTLHLLQTPHVYQQTYEPMLKDFTAKTGITVVADLVPEADYFTKLNTELAGGQGTHDVFMMGAYWVWQYGPPSWLENLDPWLANSSATAPDYDYEDIFEGLRTSMKWDFKDGSKVGTGGTYAIPWGFEINNIAYNKQVFDAKGIKLPNSFDNLIDLAVSLTDRSKNQYGIAFRGSRSWATIHPGFMTQFAREGGVDYEFKNGALTGVMNSDAAVTFTQKWADLAKHAGPTSWTTYDYPQCTGDLGDGVAMMVYDADSATYPKNKPGASKMAGNLGWWAGPPGANGSYATNIWTWALGLNAKSKNKLAAWLFMQWASSKEATTKAVQTGTLADPPRKSVFDGPFKQSLGSFPGYLDAFDQVIAESKILFTPQKKFLETTEDWAVALQDIYGGANAKSRLDQLAAEVTKKQAS
ncbi:MAG: ABC transporter substrate-binding protein [Propionibacteriaceae bacterium]